MADVTLDFGDPTDKGGRVKAQAVYAKSRWEDDWQQVPYLYCTRCRWATAPEISTAEFSWQYGYGLRQLEAQFARVNRQAQSWGKFVRVDFQTFAVGDETPEVLFWVGVVEFDRDAYQGTLQRVVADANGQPTVEAVDIGEQRLGAYGLEVLLERQVLTYSSWLDAGSDPSEVIWAHRGLTYNTGGIGNRSSAKQWDSYHFDGRPNKPTWSTRDIAEHLIATCQPASVHPSGRVPPELPVLGQWTFEDPDNAAFDWDAPELPTHGRTLRQLLNRLFDRRRLRTYRVQPASRTSKSIKIQPIALNFGLFESGEPGDPRPVWPSSGDDYTLKLAGDPDNQVELGAAPELVDQVVLLGARRQSCFTASYAATDPSLELAEDSTETSAYDDGGSQASDFPAAAEVREREKWHVMARSGGSEADRALKRFGLPASWNFKSENGDNVFPDQPLDTSGPFWLGDERVYRGELRIQPVLPLLDGWDYSGSRIGDGTATATGAAPYEPMRPLVVAAVPSETDKYVRVEDVGTGGELEDLADGDNWQLSGTVVVTEDGVLEVHLSGQPQHSLAASDFTGETEDRDRGDSDWRDWLFTVAVEADQHAEGRYPKSITPPLPEFPRRLVIEAGDAYRLDYVAPQTVVATDDGGELVRSDGGFVRDDTPELASKAFLVWSDLRDFRRALQFATSRVNSALDLGSRIAAVTTNDTTAGLDYAVGEVRSLIVAIELELPESAPPRIVYETDPGRLDVFAI